MTKPVTKYSHDIVVHLVFNHAVTEEEAKYYLRTIMHHGKESESHLFGRWGGNQDVRLLRFRVLQSLGRSMRRLLTEVGKKIMEKNAFLQGSYSASAEIVDQIRSQIK